MDSGHEVYPPKSAFPLYTSMNVINPRHNEFGIRNLQPGDYTLEITADGRKPSKHKITVPAPSYDVEV